MQAPTITDMQQRVSELFDIDNIDKVDTETRFCHHSAMLWLSSDYLYGRLLYNERLMSINDVNEINELS